MAGEMVAVCRSDGVFLILPMVAAAVRFAQPSCVRSGYRGLNVQVLNGGSFSCVCWSGERQQ
jgi:hypothetical protein